MLVVGHAVFQKKTKKWTKKQQLLSLCQPALPPSEKNVFKRVDVYGGFIFMAFIELLTDALHVYVRPELIEVWSAHDYNSKWN